MRNRRHDTSSGDILTDGVTVIICTRNGRSKGFLQEALRSVVEQTVAPTEILLVDDSSTDGTAEWIHRNFPQVKVVGNQGEGLAAAKNTGIASTKTRWIAFMDDDDLWHPEKLSVQLGQANASSQPDNTIWVARAAEHREAASAPVRAVPLLHLSQWPACLLGFPIMNSSAFLATDLLRRIGRFDESIRQGSGRQYWMRCLSAGVNVCHSDRILWQYRLHKSQMSRLAARPAIDVEFDKLLVPFLQMLSPAIAARIRTAKMMCGMRSLAYHVGMRAARDYWENTSLKPGRFGLRVCAYFLLDTAALRAPESLEWRLKSWAIQVLLKSSTRAK